MEILLSIVIRIQSLTSSISPNDTPLWQKKNRATTNISNSHITRFPHKDTFNIDSIGNTKTLSELAQLKKSQTLKHKYLDGYDPSEDIKLFKHQLFWNLSVRWKLLFVYDAWQKFV